MARTRELFALAVLPFLVAGIIFLPAWCFLTLLGMVAVVAGDELLAMARKAGMPCGRWLPLAALALLMAASWWYGPAALAVAAIATVVILPIVQLWHRERPRGALAGAATASFVVLYTGSTAVCLGWIRELPADHLGFRLLLFFLATIWAGDSGAYYVGRNFGRHKMSPRISPNKTWEGLLGGVLASLLGAVILSLVLGVGIAWLHVLGLAVILAVTAPVGDLVESLFKRDTGVKDSSSILPGHGGFLDRTDSLFFSAPWFLSYLLAAGLAP